MCIAFSATGSALELIPTISVGLVLPAALTLSGRTYSTSTWKNLSTFSSEVVIKYIATGRSFALSLLVDSPKTSPWNDYRLIRERELNEWVSLKSMSEKISFPVTDAILAALDRYLFRHYCLMFRNGVFAQCNRSMRVNHAVVEGLY